MTEQFTSNLKDSLDDPNQISNRRRGSISDGSRIQNDSLTVSCTFIFSLGWGDYGQALSAISASL